MRVRLIHLMDTVGIETIKPISTNKTEIALDSDELK